MRVGCPREIKNNEFRVGLTPESAHELVAHGHEVWIESGAGLGIGASDEDYAAAGAIIDQLRRLKTPAPILSPASQTALHAYESAQAHLPAALGRAQNGRRLLGLPELRDDVAYCAQVNRFPLVAMLDAHGALVKMPQ